MDDKHPMGINWENVARHAMDIEIPAKNTEIADLREKCDKLAGAVETLRATYVDMRGNVRCKLCDAEAAYSYDIVHEPDCPVQIAREVQR